MPQGFKKYLVNQFFFLLKRFYLRRNLRFSCYAKSVSVHPTLNTFKGVYDIFSNQIWISGLLETWIMADELYGDILSLQLLHLFRSCDAVLL